jgi:hypothetical protein
MLAAAVNHQKIILFLLQSYFRQSVAFRQGYIKVS